MTASSKNQNSPTKKNIEKRVRRGSVNVGQFAGVSGERP